MRFEEDRIISGAMHYFRVPRPYWQDRLLKLKELGCDAVETYIAWNLHEQAEGFFCTDDNLDFCHFFDVAHELGLKVILRPGPYICSELDFGGLPWWLLKYSGIKLRCMEDNFIRHTTNYINRICKLILPHLETRGGNIIALQIENEYGSYGTDKKYLEHLKNLYIDAGIDIPFFTSDGALPSMLSTGTVTGAFATVNFRTQATEALGYLKNFAPSQPLYVMEYWNGIGTRWGKKAQRQDIDEVVYELDSILSSNSSVNLYMFHGGTTFGFMNGSLILNGGEGDEFLPQLTSYDVDAPLSENGCRTEKYYREREIIFKHKKTAPPALSAKEIKAHDYGSFKLDKAADLFSCLSVMDLPSKKHCCPLNMEAFDCGYGYARYSAVINFSAKGGFFAQSIHDAAHFYLNGRFIGSIYRLKEDKTFLSADVSCGDRIDIIVENLGRVNFGTDLLDKKGVIGDILFKGTDGNINILHGFEMTAITMQSLPSEQLYTCLSEKYKEQNMPCFYKTCFNIEECADTFLEVTNVTRGVVFINGFNLGRHWDIGSQKTLYVPANLLKCGMNEIVVFDVLSKSGEKTVKLGSVQKVFE